ncbi:oxidoreductase [Roseateles toxinivorans]|uniref:Short-subunit dehydrogenase n=1 Tax=Roseateles toxinivorans TaxID=270368 RepID=A0A4R6QP68_9BURK|nr:oxidoreductase [Roseateles toxinivorans]TDP72282.1 short-subunit dehydrogenase [Roseateles toxinivorans]
MQKTWFITGASRGLGAEIAKAALRADDRVVAAGRSRAAVSDCLGPDSDRLLAVELDVNNEAQAQAAVDAAVLRFGTIDVLVNNAGYGHLGLFEETSAQDVQTQFGTNLFGVFSVTRVVLPIMRAARKGRIFNISSLAGLRGTAFGSLYCASKFALEGFSESLAQEVAPFGIRVVIVEPGPFRTDFLSAESVHFAAHAVTDYDEARASLRASFEQRNGRQPGDPAKLAEALVLLANEAEPPLRFVAGSIAFDAISAKLSDMQTELARWRSLSVGTDG